MARTEAAGGVLGAFVPEAGPETVRRRVRTFRRRWLEVEAEMTELVTLTQGVPQRFLVLDLQRRSNGSQALRWRDGRGVMRSRAAVAELISALPEPLRRRYAELDAHAVWLNAEARIVRYCIGVFDDVLQYDEEQTHQFSAERAQQ